MQDNSSLQSENSFQIKGCYYHKTVITIAIRVPDRVNPITAIGERIHQCQ